MYYNKFRVSVILLCRKIVINYSTFRASEVLHNIILNLWLPHYYILSLTRVVLNSWRTIYLFEFLFSFST